MNTPVDISDVYKRQGLNKMKSNIDSKQFSAIASAAAYALLELDGNKKTLELYQKRRDIITDGLNSLGWKLPKSKATLYVCCLLYTSRCV